MPKEIIWSPSSEKDFGNILDFLNQKWGNKVVLVFIERVDFLLTHVSQHPKHYPIFSHKRNIRKCVVSSHNTLFYREQETSIQILRLFDTRQNPIKLTFD